MRTLIFSADIGEGHELPARMVADGIRGLVPGAEVTIVDTLQVAGSLTRMLVREGSEMILRQLPAIYDVQYALAMNPPLRGVGKALAPVVAGRGLRRTVAEHRPDVIVSTYPLATQVLAVLRQLRRMPVPVVSAITDLAALHYWAHPGCDLHLLTQEESVAEVRAIAGPDARMESVRGLTDPGFDRPVDPAAARASLGLPADAPIVLVSGGGWGVGDLEGAVATVVAAVPTATVVCLCGRNEELLATINGAFGRDPRVVPMGFTDRMSDLMAAADVLVHSTAGLTALEALIRGTRVVSYGWGVGHIRVNNAAFERFGLARVATDRPALAEAVRGALADGPVADFGYGARRSAAELIVELAAGSLVARAGSPSPVAVA